MTPTSGSTRRTTASAIRLNFPPLTEERRKEFVRMVKQKAEDGRTAVRAAAARPARISRRCRRTATSPRTTYAGPRTELDKITKRFEAEIDTALDPKTVELMAG